MSCKRIATKAKEMSTARQERSPSVYEIRGNLVETKSGNHKVLKAWKEKSGAAKVEEWLQ